MILPALTAAMSGVLVDQRAPRGVDQDRASLHSRDVLGADDAAAARRQDHVHGDGVGISHEIGLGDEACAGFLGLCLGQVRTPGDNVHVERNGEACHARAETTETDDAERFAGEPHAHRHAALEATGSHGPIGNRDGAGGGDEQAKRQFGRCVAERRQLCCRL